MRTIKKIRRLIMDAETSEELQNGIMKGLQLLSDEIERLYAIIIFLILVMALIVSRL